MTTTFEYNMSSRSDGMGYPIKVTYAGPAVDFYAGAAVPKWKFAVQFEQLDELITALLYIKKLGEENEQTAPK